VAFLSWPVGVGNDHKDMNSIVSACWNWGCKYLFKIVHFYFDILLDRKPLKLQGSYIKHVFWVRICPLV